jgi:hypothetical protein
MAIAISSSEALRDVERAPDGDQRIVDAPPPLFERYCS